MIKKSKFYISSFIFSIPFILGSIYYKQLPDTMAVHFNMQNSADDFAPKEFALFGVPLFLICIHFINHIALNYDPKKSSHPKIIKETLYWLIPIVTLFVDITLISYNLGKSFNITTYMLVGTGLLILILGNYFPKLRQNYTLGIRLPWTLASEENWYRTHRMAGKLWSVSGLLIILAALLQYTTLLILLFLIIGLVPCIYSFLLYKHTTNHQS